MSIYSWEDIFVEEWIAQKQRDMYLDMRNAHILVKEQIKNKKQVIDGTEYQRLYKKIFENLILENGFSGQIRKRSTNVW